MTAFRVASSFSDVITLDVLTSIRRLCATAFPLAWCGPAKDGSAAVQLDQHNDLLSITAAPIGLLSYRSSPPFKGLGFHRNGLVSDYPDYWAVMSQVTKTRSHKPCQR